MIPIILNVYLLFRNALTKVLRDIIDKTHDKKACKINCKENGKVFNQTPYQCRYFSKGLDYNSLLEYQELSYSDTVDDVTTVASNSTKDKIVEYQFQLSLLEDLKADVDDGVRAKEDLNELEQNLGNL